MNKTVEYSENDLASLISEVEDKFSKHLEKAEPESEDTIEKNEEVAASQEAETNTEVIAKSEGEGEGEGEVITFDYDDKDIEEMNEMYGSMTKSEKEAHYKSIKKSLFGDKEPAQVAKTEEAPAAEVKKTEEAPAVSENSDEVAKLADKLEKSEEKYADLQKNFQELLGKLGGFVKKSTVAPKQKAITKIEYIQKSEDTTSTEVKKDEKKVEDLSKSEIADRLTAKVRSGKLEKSDKEAINNYYLERKQDIESIKHLL